MAKTLSKWTAALAALALVLMFVSCSDDDDDDADLVASYSSTVTVTADEEDEDAEDEEYTYHLYFWSNNTFVLEENGVLIATGTYTGDAASDGSVVLTIVKALSGIVNEDDTTSMISYSETFTITISDGAIDFTKIEFSNEEGAFCVYFTAMTEE